MASYKPGFKYKSISNIMMDYIKQSEQIGAKIPELEDLKRYFGKKGQLLKRPLRSKKQQKQFEERVKAYRDKYGRGNKKKIKKELERQRAKDQKRFKKARDTYREKQKQKQKAAASGGPVNMRSIAQKASRQYSRMVDAFMDESLKVLRDEYNIGSGLIEAMAEKGLTASEMVDFINNIISLARVLPEEAQGLLKEDDFFEVAMEIKDMDQEQFAEMLTGYIDAISEGEGEAFRDLLDEYQQSNTEVPFAEVWQDLQGYMDPYNIDNLYEVLEAREAGEEEEEEDD